MLPATHTSSFFTLPHYLRSPHHLSGTSSSCHMFIKAYEGPVLPALQSVKAMLASRASNQAQRLLSLHRAEGGRYTSTPLTPSPPLQTAAHTPGEQAGANTTTVWGFLGKPWFPVCVSSRAFPSAQATPGWSATCQHARPRSTPGGKRGRRLESNGEGTREKEATLHARKEGREEASK